MKEPVAADSPFIIRRLGFLQNRKQQNADFPGGAPKEAG